jgi:hypothetical protein
MTKTLKILCLVFAGVLMINTGCDSKPVNIDLGDNGYKLDSFYTNSNFSRSIQDGSGIGHSSRLYLGKLDSVRSSYALLKLNKDVLENHSDICSLPSDSVIYKESFIRLNSVIRLTTQGEISESDSAYQDNHFDFHEEFQSFQAFWINFDNTDFSWNEFSTFSLNDSIITEIGELSNIQSYNSNISELVVTVKNFILDIHLIPTLGGNNNYLSDLCDASSSDSYGILLRYNNPDEYIELYSTDYSILSGQPYFDAMYEKYTDVFLNENKYEISSVTPIAFDLNGILSDLESASAGWGTVIAMNFDLDSPPSGTINPQIGMIDSTFELMSFEIDLIDHETDSSGLVDIYLSDIILANMDIDPSNDNYSENDTLGTENNFLPDDGELYFDCGLDGLCDEDEPGYFPEGTENNELWDDGEFFSDTGIDSLFNIDEPNYDAITNPDPNSDDYNIDPTEDNWLDCGFDNICPEDANYIESDEGENNGEWDFGETGEEGNGQFENGELYWDYGLDGIHDVNEPGYDAILNPDPNNDNWDENTQTGTEGNNIFDWTDVNDDDRMDDDDVFEVFMDAGLDTLWSLNEDGFNPLGTEGNGLYNFGEGFEDCGIDMVCDEPDDIDDYIPDPSEDNYDVENNPDGTEINGVLDWQDSNDNGLWDMNEGEEWFDWGVDQVQNELEPYYGGRRINLPSAINFVEWDFVDNPTITFDMPTYNQDQGEEAVIWISSIEPDGTPEKYIVTLSVNTSIALHGFQLKLNHIPFSFTESQLTEFHTGLRYIEGDKLIEDVSLYQQHEIDEDSLINTLQIKYGDNLKAYLDFTELIDFQIEHQDAIISKSLLTLYIDSSRTDIDGTIFLNVNRMTDPLELPVDSLMTNEMNSIVVSEINDGIIQIDIKPFIQDIAFGEYEFFGLILEASSLGNNFSILTINNDMSPDTLKPQIEILFSE